MSALTFTHTEHSRYAYFEDAACHDDDRSEVRRSDCGTWERGGYHSYMSSDQWEVLEGSDARRLENEYQRLVKEGTVEGGNAVSETDPLLVAVKNTVLLLDERNEPVGCITFASSTYFDAIKERMVAGCRLELTGGFILDPPNAPQMVEARVVPLPERPREGT